ncbi:hypothetical protein L3Q82_007820 [Scortum barcoo]|uniref:Uncharacterized protein n=1 Tax=Scortum barcoo TaxID=214431 RepID=A0ACB8WKC5_9TELE|nr:hypothetical protein L3Q82_007820 [Scortum barcoo]
MMHLCGMWMLMAALQVRRVRVGDRAGPGSTCCWSQTCPGPAAPSLIYQAHRETASSGLTAAEPDKNLLDVIRSFVRSHSPRGSVHKPDPGPRSGCNPARSGSEEEARTAGAIRSDLWSFWEVVAGFPQNLVLFKLVAMCGAAEQSSSSKQGSLPCTRGFTQKEYIIEMDQELAEGQAVFNDEAFVEKPLTFAMMLPDASCMYELSPTLLRCWLQERTHPNVVVSPCAAAIPHCCTKAEDALYCGPVEVCQELRGESRVQVSCVHGPGQVTGQTKSGSEAHHEKKNIKDRYVARIGRYRGPTLEPGLGLGLAGERLVAGSLPTGPGRAQPEMATWPRGPCLPVGSPPAGRSMRGRCNVVWVAVVAGQGPRRPNPWNKTLAIGTWNVTSLGGRSLSSCRKGG